MSNYHQPFSRRSTRFRYAEEMYGMWFEWLKVNPAYIAMCEGKGGTKKMQAIYRDWGDIRNVDFMTWFEADGRNRARRLFAERMNERDVFEAEGDFKPNQQGFLYIAVQRNSHWRIVEPRVLKILKQHFPQTPLHKRESDAKYPMTDRINVEFNKRTLDVWKVSDKNPSWSLDQIAKAVGITGEKHNREAQVGHIRKRAIEIMKAVEQGYFPKLPKQPKQRKR